MSLIAASESGHLGPSMLALDLFISQFCRIGGITYFTKGCEYTERIAESGGEYAPRKIKNPELSVL